jgi:hypothetical protein
LEPGSSRDIGRIVLESREKAVSLFGDKTDWRRFQHLAGPTVPEGFTGPALLMFAGQQDAHVVVDALEAAKRILDNEGLAMIAVMTEGATVANPSISVMSGPVPGAARTYLLDAAGTIVMETFGMPPYAALKRLATGVGFE